jgi:hypothetical protein
VLSQRLRKNGRNRHQLFLSSVHCAEAHLTSRSLVGAVMTLAIVAGSGC